MICFCGLVIVWAWDVCGLCFLFTACVSFVCVLLCSVVWSVLICVVFCVLLCAVFVYMCLNRCVI